VLDALDSRTPTARASGFVYARRRPELGTLYQVVRDNLQTLYAAAEEGFASPLPAFLRRELEQYLDCGLLCRGFAWLAFNGRVGASHGYSLYAGNAIDADDKDVRERLLRYCLRAPLSLERLSIASDGNVIYQVKATRHGIETQRVMTPMQFMSRLVALIPPPFHPLVRYFGVFGPHSSWRKSVVPGVAATAKQPDQLGQSGAPPATELPRGGDVDSAFKISADPTAALNVSVPSAKESNKLAAVEDGEPRLSPRWRIDWATLLKRAYQADALACPCGGRLCFVDLVTEPATAKEVLQSMGLPVERPPIARARSPAFYDEPAPVDWD